MADQITESTNLIIEYAFVDGDTRQQNIKNPRSNITREDIQELNTFMRANNAVLGDRYQSTFAQINSAVKRRITKNKLDIEPD